MDDETLNKLFPVFPWHQLRLGLTKKVVCQPKKGYSTANMKIFYEKLYLSVSCLKSGAITQLNPMLNRSCWILCLFTSVDKLHSSAKSRILTFGLI